MALMDDPSPVVRKALLKEFNRLGEDAIVFLQSIISRRISGLSDCAEEYLDALSEANPVRAFIDFIRSYNYELETGSLMLSKTLGEHFDVGACCLFLDEMAQRCKQLIIPESSLYKKCMVLNRVFFHEYGFVGDVEDFYNPRNTFIHSVIERRRGIPISLCILYLLVAGRSGVELEPVGLPGRFMVGCYLEGEPFFIDVYEHGMIRTVESVETMLNKNDIEFDPAYLAPTPVAEVLIRCCRNLVTQFNEVKDFQKARVFSGFLDEFEKVYQRDA